MTHRCTRFPSSLHVISLSLSLCVCVHVCAYLLEYDNALPEEPLCDFGRDEEVSLGRVQQMQLDIPKGEERVIEVHAELLCACIFHAHASPSSRSFVEAHHSQPARRASSLLDSEKFRNSNARRFLLSQRGAMMNEWMSRSKQESYLYCIFTQKSLFKLSTTDCIYLLSSSYSFPKSRRIFTSGCTGGERAYLEPPGAVGTVQRERERVLMSATMTMTSATKTKKCERLSVHWLP